MDASASPTNLRPPSVDAGADGANPIELDAASLLSSTPPAASSATLASLTEPQPAQARVGPDALDDDFPARFYELESAARSREGASEKGSSSAWSLAFRLKPSYFDEYELKIGAAGVATHVCRAPVVDDKGEPLPGKFCNKLLVLCRQKAVGSKLGPFITTKFIAHCSKEHQSTDIAAAAAAKVKTLAYSRQNALLASGGGLAVASSSKLPVQSKLKGMVLTSQQKALCSQVGWFVYSRQAISKSTFGDKSFRNMLQCNDPPGEPTPILSIKMIDKWVEAEYAIFLRFFQHALALKVEQAKSNPFGQAQHDGGTLANHKKVQVEALQWVDPINWRNHVVVFALSSLDSIRTSEDDYPPLIDCEYDCEGLPLTSLPPMLFPAAHTDVNVAKDYTLNLEKASGLKFELLVATAIQDGAACGVAGHLALSLSEREICNMHAASKIGAAALGFLTRSRMKKVIDPFPAGKKVSARVLEVTKQFSPAKAREALARIAERLADVSTARMPPRAERPRGSARARMCLRARTG